MYVLGYILLPFLLIPFSYPRPLSAINRRSARTVSCSSSSSSLLRVHAFTGLILTVVVQLLFGLTWHLKYNNIARAMGLVNIAKLPDLES